MIRDLRSSPPIAPADASSLAFSRDLLASDASLPRSRRTTNGAFTIAVTAPRMLTCKRGLAAYLATHLASVVNASGSTVCVVDADIESRDVGVRFGVIGPLLLDVAKQMAVDNGRTELQKTITCIDPPGIWVLPTRPPQSALLPLLQAKTSTLLGPLEAAFDYVVIDAPVGLGVNAAEWDQAILRHVDALLVAVTADPSAIGGALRYLNAIAAASRKAMLPSTFSAHLVITGSEHDGTRTLVNHADLEDKLHGLPVIASIPQLWGRQRPDGPLDAALQSSLHQSFEPMVRALTTLEQLR